jgi:hypothetical protein
MLSREPPRSTVGYLHGERNTPKMRFKDPRNTGNNAWGNEKNSLGRRCSVQVYTNRGRIASAHYWTG